MKPALVKCRYCKDLTENTGTCVCSPCRKLGAMIHGVTKQEFDEIVKQADAKIKKKKYTSSDVYSGDFYRK